MVEEMRTKQTLVLFVLRCAVAVPTGQASGNTSCGSQSGLEFDSQFPPGYLTAERLMPHLDALGDEALAGFFCVALERRPWLTDKVFGTAMVAPPPPPTTPP